TGTATPPTGPPIPDTTPPVTVTADQHPSIDIAKSASPTAYSAVGTTITYTYLVTNTGNVTLTGTTVTDPAPGLSAISCTGGPTLAPTQSETCTATHSVTQGDLDAGSVTNVGTAMATAPDGTHPTKTSTATVSATQSPLIGVIKSANPTHYDHAGQ